MRAPAPPLVRETKFERNSGRLRQKHVDLAKSYERDGKLEEAVQHYQKALEGACSTPGALERRDPELGTDQQGDPESRSDPDKSFSDSKLRGIVSVTDLLELIGHGIVSPKSSGQFA